MRNERAKRAESLEAVTHTHTHTHTHLYSGLQKNWWTVWRERALV